MYVTEITKYRRNGSKGLGVRDDYDWLERLKDSVTLEETQKTIRSQIVKSLTGCVWNVAIRCGFSRLLLATWGGTGHEGQG